MSKPELGKLESADNLNVVWENEPKEFTPWLADNISLLCEALGLELEVEELEKDVGPFRADILCKDDQNNWVVIENQLTKTDHVHLGQILTYAAGLQASAVIWVAEDFRPEHRAALDWLNERTGEGAAFYGVEVELLRIGNSPWAPRFNIVSKPNDFSKAARGAVSGLSDIKRLQLEFWTALEDYLKQKSTIIRPLEPKAIHWRGDYLHGKDYHLLNSISLLKGQLRVFIQLQAKYAEDYFNALEREKSKIEQELRSTCEGIEQLDWQPCAGGAGWISVRRRPTDFSAKDRWPEYFEWPRTRTEAFYTVFQPRLKAIEKELDELNGEGDSAQIGPPTASD